MTNFEIFKEGLRILNDLPVLIRGEIMKKEGVYIDFKESDYLHEYVNRYDHLVKFFNRIKDSLSKEDVDILSKFVDLHWEERCVDHYGGEGQGEKYYTVHYFPTVDMYIRFNGYYQSYNGADYIDCKEVYPEQKVITVYE